MWSFWQVRSVRMKQMLVASSARLWRSPRVRRQVPTAAALLGCFVWTMVVIGLSFAAVERHAPQWWLMLVFGMAAPLVTLVVVRSVRTLANVRDGYRPSSPAVARLETADGLPAEPLSGRELEVLELLAAGRSNTEIAKALYVAPGTVKAHLNRIFRKLGAASRLQAVTHARQWGLLEGADRNSNRP